MPLGWIDFSKDERTKVLSILHMLVEEGTLDEMGIAPIRDGFANVFFPGTSTIQTRAKYFCIVPYALKKLEYSGESKRNRFLQKFDEVEKECGKKLREQALLLKNEDNEDAKIKSSGVIGGRSLGGGRWVKRTPADIYWAGLKKYNIFIGGDISLSEYAGAVCNQNKEKNNTKEYRRVKESDDDNLDDKNAGSSNWHQFWSIATFDGDWFKNLSMKLTADESAFLKEKIILSCPDSMMAHVLKNNIREFIDITDWADLETIIDKFPEEMQKKYYLANAFSQFNQVLGTIYNIIISKGEYAYANELFKEMKLRLEEIASVDLKSIIDSLRLSESSSMYYFLTSAQLCMQKGDIEGLKTIIKEREKNLKGINRARTYHVGEYEKDRWFGLGALDYRLYTAKRLVRDIFEGEEISND